MVIMLLVLSRVLLLTLIHSIIKNGVGCSITNEGYAQIVSMFTINNAEGVFCGSGGQCDITNSNSSFGNFGLVADGKGPLSYAGTLTSATSENLDTFSVDLSTPTLSVTNAEYTASTGIVTYNYIYKS